MMKSVFFFWSIAAVALLSTLVPRQSSAQVLQVGDKLPQQVWTQIPNVSGKRLVILDFWNTYCGSCMAAFPKLDSLQEQFAADIGIVLVNSRESKETVINRLTVMNKRRLTSGDTIAYPTTLSSIYADTILSGYFPHRFVPHHVWLNQEGTVLAIANANYTNKKYIKDFLDGGIINKISKNDFELDGFDPIRDPLFRLGHPNLRSVFSSGLLPFQTGLGSGNSWFTDTVNNVYRRAWRNYTPLDLYKRALSYLSVSAELINELDQSTLFDRPINEWEVESWRESHLYTYEITIPIDVKHELGMKMIHDLNGYFEVLYGIRADFQVGSLPKSHKILVIHDVKKR